jgi:hypothetical protein
MYDENWAALLLLSCVAYLHTFAIAGQPAFAQNASTCGNADWFAVQQAKSEGAKLSPLCQGELDAAADLDRSFLANRK